MFFKVLSRQREPPKYIVLYAISLDFHLIRLPYAFTKPATPWRLTSINILGPGPARARPAAAGRFVPQGPGYAFQDAFSSFQGSDF